MRSVTWKPGRLNVLIGPNGGGKSNLLAALDLIRISADGNLRKTILAQGGMMALAWNATPRVTFTLKTTAAASAPSFDYHFEIERVGNFGSHLLSGERLASSDGFAMMGPFPTRDGSETMLSEFRSLGSDPIGLLRNTIKDWSIHQHVRNRPTRPIAKRGRHFIRETPRTRRTKPDTSSPHLVRKRS